MQARPGRRPIRVVALVRPDVDAHYWVGALRQDVEHAAQRAVIPSCGIAVDGPTRGARLRATLDGQRCRRVNDLLYIFGEASETVGQRFGG